MNQVRTLRIWDFLGMGLSVVCLVHCLAIPFLLGFLPFLASSLMHHEDFHFMLIAVVLPVAGLALVPGYLRTGRQSALRWGFFGLLLLGGGILSGHELGELFETLFTVIGAVCLFRAHWINHARPRQTSCTCPH